MPAVTPRQRTGWAQCMITTHAYPIYLSTMSALQLRIELDSLLGVPQHAGSNWNSDPVVVVISGTTLTRAHLEVRSAHAVGQ